MSYLHFISLWRRVARERQNFQRCVICISCVEGFCRTRKTRCEVPQLAVVSGASLGCGIAPGHFALAGWMGSETVGTRARRLHSKPPRAFCSADISRESGSIDCFRTTKNPLPAFSLPSHKSRLPIKDPSNRLRPLQNSRQGLESRKVPNQPADALL